MKQGNKRALKAVTTCLDAMRVPYYQSSDDEKDASVTIIGTPYRLRPRWIETSEDDLPADLLAGGHQNDDDIPVLVTDRWTTSARAHLDGLRVSWADEVGHLRVVSLPEIYLARDIDRETVPRERPSATRSGPTWSSSAGAVAELLLTNHERELFGRSPAPTPANHLIAAQLPYSAAQVSKVMQGFDDRGWTLKDGHDRGPGASRILVDAGGMLSSWAQWVSRRRGHRVLAHATWRDPHSFFRDRLMPALEPRSWCASGWLAADLIAPFTTTIPDLTVYLEPQEFRFGLSRIFEAAGLRPVDAGARVVLREAERHVLSLARHHDDVPVASDVRVYADLLNAGVRGDDTAAHLREVRIGF